jgi:hypothetical protein
MSPSCLCSLLIASTTPSGQYINDSTTLVLPLLIDYPVTIDTPGIQDVFLQLCCQKNQEKCT